MTVDRILELEKVLLVEDVMSSFGMGPSILVTLAALFRALGSLAVASSDNTDFIFVVLLVWPGGRCSSSKTIDSTSESSAGSENRAHLTPAVGSDDECGLRMLLLLILPLLLGMFDTCCATATTPPDVHGP